jgi:dTDP-4-dehydrorhamnose 3,5-epimerase
VRFVAAAIRDVVVIEPDVHRDSRGFFLETYHAEKYLAGGVPGVFVQDNQSRSTCGTIRGLHLQLRRPQGKLIRVIEGEIFDVAVDVRRGSPDFGKWVGVVLSADNFRQCYIPPGFAHGFAVVSEVAQVEYKCTDLYDAAGDRRGMADRAAVSLREGQASSFTVRPHGAASVVRPIDRYVVSSTNLLLELALFRRDAQPSSTFQAVQALPLRSGESLV